MHWLSPGDNAWQMTAATLVGLMSVPGLVVLYGGVMQKRWSVNSMMMAFVAFALVLVVWVLFGFKMAFGEPMHIFGADGGELLRQHVGKAAPVLNAGAAGPGGDPLDPRRASVSLPAATLVYFQFVFAAITPILMLGSVLGRINFKAWIPFVILWSSLVYTVNAFLIWGGGFLAQHGAVDYSGGYVIHLAAGVSGFVAAAVVGPRLQRDREVDAPNNLLMVATGAGLLWLGWNGFNGGDPYYAGANAAAAVLNTNLCTAVAFLSWVAWDYITGQKPSLISSVNGMITGLVCITPSAGFVNGWEAMAIGVIGGVDRVLRPQLPQPPAAVPERRRHARGGVHARLRRIRRRPARRAVRQPEHDPLPRREGTASIAITGWLHGNADVQVAAGDGDLGDPLLGDRNLHPPAAREALRAAADGREGHGGGRPRRPRPRGVSVRRALARLPLRDPGGAAGAARAGPGLTRPGHPGQPQTPPPSGGGVLLSPLDSDAPERRGELWR